MGLEVRPFRTWLRWRNTHPNGKRVTGNACANGKHAFDFGLMKPLSGINQESDRLIVFAKAPRLGSVKTRLAANLGEAAALAAYCEMISCVLRNLHNLHSLGSLTLCITPDESLNEFGRWAQPEWRVWPQGDGDLGSRLARAFARAFQEGAQRIAVIGMDCPYVRIDHIRAAWRTLATSDLVLGPAKDGGYWLIGLSRVAPQLFSEMPWSEPTLLESTLAAARSQNLRVGLLETLADIDTVEDWHEYQAGASSRSL